MFWRYGKFLCSCVYIACHLTSFDHRNWQMQRADKCQMKGWEMQQLAPHSMDPTWSTGVAAAWFPLVPLDKPPKWLRREPMEPMVGLCWATFHFGLCNPCLDCRNWTLKRELSAWSKNKSGEGVRQREMGSKGTAQCHEIEKKEIKGWQKCVVQDSSRLDVCCLSSENHSVRQFGCVHLVLSVFLRLSSLHFAHGALALAQVIHTLWTNSSLPNSSSPSAVRIGPQVWTGFSSIQMKIY